VELPIFLGPQYEVIIATGRGGLTVGRHSYFSSGVAITAVGQVTIGSRCFFNRGVIVAAYGSVVIGDAVLIGPYSTIHDHDHELDPGTLIREQEFVVAPVRIGSDVLIGTKATILKGVEVGDGAVVGAGAVVVDSVPPGAIVVGNPARVVGHRRD
jgi:acetyltransferase-like isoleucine patch superfamily enzyme